MNELSINASEIRSITTITAPVNIPLIDAETSTAEVRKVYLGDAELTALTITLQGSEDVTAFVDLNSGLLYELLPVQPEYTTADADETRLNKIQLEETIKK